MAEMNDRYTYGTDTIVIAPGNFPEGAGLNGFQVNNVKYTMDSIISGGDNITVSEYEGCYNYVVPEGITNKEELPAISISAIYSYKVSLDDYEAGYYVPGETVHLPAPESVPSGKIFAGFTIADGNSDYTITKVDNTYYTFVMPSHAVSITTDFEEYSDTISGEVTQSIIAGLPYKFAAGKKYKVVGDITVYMGGQTFYSTETRQLTFTEEQ